MLRLLLRYCCAYCCAYCHAYCCAYCCAFGPSCGQAGDVINDHDIALAYVLDHFPDSLPSFAMLPPEQQKSVRFTQSKMGFNHGWLVQAEAPPSALFAQFKKIVSAGEIVPQALIILIILTDTC